MRFIRLIIAFTVLSVLAACTQHRKADYTILLFDTSKVHTIDVQIAEADWQDLLAHAEDKTKYQADIVIDGELMEQVSFSAKGNSSLAAVKYNGGTRYSFKVNFGKYNKEQTWHGLDKLNLQSCFKDATYMKEYMAYELFRRNSVPSPLASYAYVTINGKDQGLYLAVEEMDKSFLSRTTDEKGNLYKPEWNEPEMDHDRMKEMEEGKPVDASGMKGSDLVYADDQPESYPDIFDNNVTASDEGSQQRVIAAIKQLNERTDLEKVLETDEIIRYFAVHNFLMNYDSYTGKMLHNYYLYEKDGKLMMMPWDYNLGFGHFPMDGVIGHENDAGLVVNLGIDTPLIRTKPEERPMWNWIVSDPGYLKQYHSAMQEIINQQFDNDAFLKEIDRIHSIIQPYIEKDPTAFFTPEEAEKGYQAMKKLSQLRADSVRSQLKGTLSPVTDTQDPRDRIDASDLDLQDLGASGF